MEELVQAINNLSEISTKDIISISSTIVIAVAVYCQNKRFNKENEILQKKLNEDNKNLQKNINEVENKRILYNNILSIYHNFTKVKDIILKFKNEKDFLNILMDYQHINDKVTRLNILKDDISKSLLEAKIIFSKEDVLLKNLITIEQIYVGFYYDFEDYIKNKYDSDYLDTIKKLCKLNDINIKRDGNSIFYNEFDNNSDIDEKDILYDEELKKQFNKNFDFEYLLTITSEFEIILNCFKEENFDVHFKEYLSIENMKI